MHRSSGRPAPGAPGNGDGAPGDASQSPGAWSPVGEPFRLIAFGLGPEWYGLDSSTVRGIEAEMEITPVPRAPAWLLGVFNLHGTILPAIDPRPLLHLPQRDLPGSGLLIVLQYEGTQLALRVDFVDEIYEVAVSSLEPQSAAQAEGSDLMLGRVRVRDHLIGVLDLPALMAALGEA